ncbi:MAG: hypothetical protein IJM09_06255 [Neisseriaceae bacterium]|nr:hypothetical protein [Neisseriaceae bacterium]
MFSGCLKFILNHIDISTLAHIYVLYVLEFMVIFCLYQGLESRHYVK